MSNPQWEQFVHNVREDAVKKIESSAFVMSVIPEAEDVDIKFCVELGLAIMLDKPILAVVQPGVRVPVRLQRVADEVLKIDVDTPRGEERLRDAVKRVLGA
jgi:nucleoside 2-deoxyribosyltransferase